MRLVKKNAQGYGYTYTDLAEITKTLEQSGIDYYQYIEPTDGVDYIVTVIMSSDGKTEKHIRGCRVVEAKLSGKSNPVQEYGAALTYCRRYSLLMAFGLATTDDDAACFTREVISEKDQALLKGLCESKGYEVDEIFPRGLELTKSQYTDAVTKLKKLPNRGA